MNKKMSTENLNVKGNSWYHIVNEMLCIADIKIDGAQPCDIRVNNSDFYKCVLLKGSLGLGESYMEGWWDCDRLDIFFQRIIAARLESQIPRHFKDTLRVVIARLTNLQSKKKSLIVGKEHYDLGNDLFTHILDPLMQYSCGYWKDADSLELAQENKLRLICEKLQLRPGLTLLDIGCGWGG